MLKREQRQGSLNLSCWVLSSTFFVLHYIPLVLVNGNDLVSVQQVDVITGFIDSHFHTSKRVI